MKTKFVYVVTSGPEDFFFEQTALSAWSLRHHNSDAYITLVVDQDTRRYIRGVRENFLLFFTETIVTQVPKEYTPHQRSRYLKTSLRELVQGDFLYIDGDTIVCQTLATIDDCQYSVAAVLDKHLPLSVHPRKEKTDYNLKKFFNYRRTPKDEKFFNGGLIFARDDEAAHRFYSTWHRLWKEGLSKGLGIDQPSLLIANAHCHHLIQELDGVWNCQLMDNGLRYFLNAKVLHYFASYPQGTGFLLKNEEIYREMKYSGEISLSIQNLVEKAKTAFENRISIVAGKEADFFETNVHACYIHHPKVFSMIESVLKMMFKFRGK